MSSGSHGIQEGAHLNPNINVRGEKDVTKPSPSSKWSQEHRFRHCFTLWDLQGGPFPSSSLSVHIHTTCP